MFQEGVPWDEKDRKKERKEKEKKKKKIEWIISNQALLPSHEPYDNTTTLNLSNHTLGDCVMEGSELYQVPRAAREHLVVTQDGSNACFNQRIFSMNIEI